MDIPPGRYRMALVPLDENQSPLDASRTAGAIATAPPVVRDVVWGEATDLEAQQVVTGCSDRCFVNSSSACDD